MTDKLREAAQMALDAFEDRYTTPEGRAAIEALRAALAKEQENSRSQKMIDAGFTKRDTLLECDGCGKKFSRLMLPIHVCENAQPEQEPVAWRTFDGEGNYEFRDYDMNENYAEEWNQRNPNHKGWVEPLYTAPPQREFIVREKNT